MPFDQSTRNRLARFVGDARALLTEEFTRQLQLVYGMDPASGVIAEVESLTRLNDAERESARLLRETLAHYLAAAPKQDAKARQEALERIVREQAFTVLNRLCALRMAEARGLLVESVARGYQSKGFQLYARIAGPALGETGDAYRTYLFSVFDELALDLAVLFDRFSPQGRLFPREAALLQLLELVNHPDIDALWGEDETIGWIYQYFNSKEERKAMRDASAAPRNSRELAVRNQFFTPRYVVEFLTDNTLGRIWYEMTQGQTALVDSCRYLVRRPDEVFLNMTPDGEATMAQRWLRGEDVREPDTLELGDTVNAYVRRGPPDAQLMRWLDERMSGVRAGGAPDMNTQELLDILCMASRLELVAPRTLDMRRVEIGAIREVLRERVADTRREERSQEELLKQPVYIPYRPLKDPRAISMLDPACGSMHFGLYAFDLFERIYSEVWDLEEEHGAQALERAPMDAPLHEAYPDKDSFLRDVPRLIVERNIHGVDIDPRAVQIAGLSLWLRAQKSWREQGVKSQERPQIRRSNVVCAEPMPGDKELLEEFIARHLSANPEDKVVAWMLRRVFDAMTLAGEAGSLLKIEDEITAIVAEAKRQWRQGPKLAQSSFFADEAEHIAQRALDLDASGITDATFWTRAEERIDAALKDYAAFAEGEGAYRRRLFAGDAARGFAFIDLCRKRYDVVLMNPPFGETTTPSIDYVGKNYPNAFIDTLAAFIERGFGLSIHGRVGALTSRACLYTKTLSEWRNKIFIPTVDVVADLGGSVLDGAMVFACASIFSLPESPSVISQAIDLRKSSIRDIELSRIVGNSYNSVFADNMFAPNRRQLLKVNNARFLYNIPNSFWDWSLGSKKLVDHGGSARAGSTTYDDFRFLRLAWEVPMNAIGWGNVWIFFSKGGYFETFYNDIHLMVNWLRDGKEVGEYNRIGYNTDAQSRRASTFYRLPGITYPRRTVKGFSPRALPKNCIFADKGPVIFPPNDTDTSFTLGYVNSSPIRALVHLQVQAGSFETGVVNTIPWIGDQTSIPKVAKLAKEIWNAKAKVYRMWDTDRIFTPPPLSTTFSIGNFAEKLVANWQLNSDVAEGLSRQISSIVSTSFSLPDIDYEAFEVSSEDHRIEDDFGVNTAGSYGFYILQLIVGFVYGRWDLRYATGEKPAPELPDPFAPLPVCPPGMLQNDQGLPAAPEDVPASYPLRISWPGILVDDEGHAEEVEGRVREAIQVIWDERAEAIEQEACEILGVRSLREYFRKPALFFADHLQRYSKSRRQAPIYWPLSIGGNYTLWLYYHRLTDQTLYSCVNDFVDPKLAQVAEQAEGLRRKAGRTAKEERELERLVDLEQELKELRAELLRVAAFWKPNLNDGVQITAAPLWKLFQHKPWQKRLKETWEKLEAGEYDWAHLAYSIWPERVREKCRSDKSLAIAHDLEHLYVELPASTKKGRGRAKKVEAVEDEGE